jgi:hypothetical protein
MDTGKLSTLGVTRANPSACDLRYAMPNVPEAASYAVDRGAAGSESSAYDELKADNE